MLKKTLRYGTLIIPPIIYIKNRVDKGKPKIVTPEQKHVVVIGAGVVGLTTSYFLSCDKNTSVTLLEKNKAIMSEASG
jgi:heterodisulfide reductase subunit A-like polyferredoxin